MSLLVGFNPDEVEDSYDDVLIPEGKYRVMLTKVEELTSNAGNDFIRWTWVIVYGKLDNTVFELAHFPHTSPGAMNAFNKHTKSLCRALKLAGVRSYEDLMDKPVIADVKVNKYKDKAGNDRQSNQIAGFEADRHPAATKRQAPDPSPIPPPKAEKDFDDDLPPF